MTRRIISIPSVTTYRALAVGILIGLVSLLIPLLRDLHWESAGLSSLVIAFYGGMRSANTKTGLRFVRDGLGLCLGWFLPLWVFALWTNCFSFDGLAYWVLGPLPSLLFGGAVGRLCRSFPFTCTRLITFIVITAVAIVPTLIEFLSFPQLYFFNHVWSYWPGPIYDEIVHFDSRLIVYRSLTVFWVLVLWSLPAFFKKTISKWILLLGVTAIMFTYLNASAWGLILSEERLKNHLGAQYETEHFLISYSPGIFDPSKRVQIGEQHESYLTEISGILELDKDDYRQKKIHSYIYADNEQKKRLTGAGQTSFVPVWLKQDQTHISFNSYQRVLKHELVHILAKRFGNWFGASKSIGLVEGLAVALAPERYPSSIDPLVAARAEWPDHEEIKKLFSPAGFYQTAGPISYLVSGSFVHHLILHYPVNLFKRAYRTADLESAYHPLSLENLVQAWHDHLDTVNINPEDRKRSAALFNTPSILEKPCPRVVKQRELQALIHYPPAEPRIIACN